MPSGSKRLPNIGSKAFQAFAGNRPDAALNTPTAVVGFSPLKTDWRKSALDGIIVTAI
jgi:hypothetical protein